MSSSDQMPELYMGARKGRTLIVGSRVYPTRTDHHARYDDAVGIDMLAGPGVDIVANLEESLPHGLGSFVHAECISVLEHSKRPWRLAKNIERLLESGGTLFVAAPFVWRIHSYPFDYWRFTCDGIKALFNEIEWLRLGYISMGKIIKKPEQMEFNATPHFARTEVYGFGAKR